MSLQNKLYFLNSSDFQNNLKQPVRLGATFKKMWNARRTLQGERRCGGRAGEVVRVQADFHMVASIVGNVKSTSDS